MSNRIVPFFATENDLSQIVEGVLAKMPLQFVKGGMFDAPEIHPISSLSGFDSITAYLIAEPHQSIVVREVPQRNGGRKFVVDQLANPQTISIRPGGFVNEQCLVAGQLGTASDDRTALTIFKLFSTRMSKEFSKIKSYLVGEEAKQLLAKGIRLTANPKSPPEYDLSR